MIIGGSLTRRISYIYYSYSHYFEINNFIDKIEHKKSIFAHVMDLCTRLSIIETYKLDKIDKHKHISNDY